MTTGLFLTSKVKRYSIHRFVGWDIFFHGACAILKEQHFWERLCGIIFIMGQWFRISCCLELFCFSTDGWLYHSQSISVCSALVSREFWGTFSVTLFGPQIQRVA